MTDPSWTPIRCVRCKTLFEENPDLVVECPTCRAPAGEPCRLVNGHAFQGGPVCKNRSRLAAETVGYCPGVPHEKH